MLRKLTMGLLAAGALGAAGLAAGAPAAADTATVTADAAPRASWIHSGFYADGGACAAALALKVSLGYDTVPFRAPCDYTPWGGYYFHYWA